MSTKKNSSLNANAKHRPQKSDGQERKENRVVVQFDLGWRYKGKKMDPKSETVPEYNLTIRQLLENHTIGKNDQTSVKEPLYFETPIPVIHDITDVEAYKEAIAAQMAEIEKFIENEQKEKAFQDESQEEIPVDESGQTSIPQ